LWVWIPLRRAVLDTTLCDKVCQWLVVGLWFSSKIKLTTLYIWHIVESDVKHHKPPSSKNLVKLFASSKGYQLLIFYFSDWNLRSWCTIKEFVLCHWRRNCLRAIQVPTRPQYTYYACTFYRRNFNMKHCSWQGVLDTTLCDKICQWLATGRWFSPVPSTNKTNRHDITEILLKVALNTINQTINMKHIKTKFWNYR
jgi:hypothetical protein